MSDKPEKPAVVDFPNWVFLALCAFWIQLFMLNLAVHRLVVLMGGF